MQHTKFQGNLPSGSGEEDFLKVFTIYGHGGHLSHVTWTKYTNFILPFARRLHMYLNEIDTVFQRRSPLKMFTDN